MKEGTLVILKVPENILHMLVEGGPRNGSIGEVKNGSPFPDITVGSVAVMFPRHIAKCKSGLWEVPAKYLIPLSGPDIDVGEDVTETVDVPVEDFVE